MLNQEPAQSVDSEIFRLDSLDEDKRPIELFEHTHEESRGLDDALSPIGEEVKRPKIRIKIMLLWILVNTLATLGIVSIAGPEKVTVRLSGIIEVFTNKTIFDDLEFRPMQLSFVTYHFALTGLLLYGFSRPRWCFFEPKWALIKILPLAIAFGFQVVLPNFSLANSTIIFYQMVRVLVTPLVAVIEFVIYRKSMPRIAVYMLVLICLGIGILSYSEAVPQHGSGMKRTSFLGVFFAFTGVLATSVYTVWIKVFRDRFYMNSMQLLSNTAPSGAVLLLYLVPFSDTFPLWTEVSGGKWIMIPLASPC